MRAAYSLYLGISTLCQKDYGLTLEAVASEPDRHAFRQGITTEVLHSKTALFFLAFGLQFVNPAGNIALQFLPLGGISASFNPLAGLVVATLDAPSVIGSSPAIDYGNASSKPLAACLVSLGPYVALTDTK